MLLEKKSFRFLNERVEIKEAPEPSNIIWQCLHISENNILCSKFAASIVFIICVGLIFFAIYNLKVIVTEKTQQRYPSFNQCKTINSFFKSDEQSFEKFAGIDKEQTLNLRGFGYF